MNRAAVLGSPINHSLSPLLHNAAYKKLGIEAEYQAFEVTSEGLRGFLEGHLASSSWVGFSLTMPLKETICSISRDLGIELDEISSRIHSANTLHRHEERWRATSTDVSGFQFLLRNHNFRDCTIIGAGGTARAALEALEESVSVNIVSRNSKREDELRRAFPRRQLTFIPWSELARAWSASLVISTVPIAAVPDLIPTFTPPELLIDALYSPWIPPLSKIQIDSGADLISGIDLLSAQALRQIELMTEVVFDKAEIFRYLKEVAEEALQQK